MVRNKAVPVQSLQQCVIPATCFFYDRICVYVCIRGHRKQPTFLDSRWHSSLWWLSAQFGRVHHLRQIFHVFRSGRSFLAEDEEIRERERGYRENVTFTCSQVIKLSNNICPRILFFRYIARIWINKLYQVWHLDSFKSSWNFSMISQIYIQFCCANLSFNSSMTINEYERCKRGDCKISRDKRITTNHYHR